MIKDKAPRKQQLWTVRRACESLLNRGLVEATRTKAETYPWANVISWKTTPAKSTAPSSPATGANDP